MDEHTTTIPAEAAEAFLAWLNAEPSSPSGMEKLSHAPATDVK